MNDDFRYLCLKEEELSDVWSKHQRIIDGFIAKNGYDTSYLYVDQKKVYAIIAKVDQRKKYFQYFHGLDISEFKETALICFWYIKMKPISIRNKDVQESAEFEAINEKLGLYYIISTLKNMLSGKNLSVNAIDNLPKEYLKEIIYSFEFRDISKEALILLVESIAVFLGLNPYQLEENH